MAIGPSTSTSPYLVSDEPNVRLVSITTVGDSLPLNGLFAGIPDGIGAFDNGNGTITVLVNHELGGGVGIVRDHGSVGAYVDRIVIDKSTLAITASDDLIKSVMLWNDSTDTYGSGTTAFNRFCSSDLPEVSAFYNAATGLGTTARIYLTGEEAGNEGRAVGVVVTGSGAGTAWELPYLGNLSYENLVANPLAQNKTIVAITDDQAGGQVYLYLGDKQATGTDIQKAGLSGGDFYGLKVTGITQEVNGAPANGNFTLQEIGPGGDVSNMTGLQINTESNAEGVTGFLRPEDAAWDPDNPNVLYFVTTASFTENSRLYQATFTDISNPQLGGTIRAVLDGSEGQRMFDNITVANGKVILQEDPGNQSYLAKVWEYDIASDTLLQVANFDPARFTSGIAGFITQDEESSGVIDVTAMLGDADTRAYLLDAQVHAQTGSPATVEMGQLMAMFVDDPVLIGGNGSDELFGSAADETMRGGNGNDVARAGSGIDFVYGGNGNDQLWAGAGNDSVFGENGDDWLYGQAGNDTLEGANGGDWLDGGAGNDRLTGGNGGDRFVIDNRVASGADVITDFGNGDRLLTTVALSDPNQDGRIELGSTLALFGGSTINIDNNGRDVTALSFVGTEVVEGLTYYSYASGAPGNGQQLTHFVGESYNFI